MKNIYDLTIEQLEDYFLSLGEKKFKAIQLYTWLYQKKIKSFDMITDIKKSVITHLENDFSRFFYQFVNTITGSSCHNITSWQFLTFSF